MNKSLKFLLAINGIFVFAANLLGPLYAVFVETIDQKIFSVSLTWSIYLIATTLTTYILFRLGDQLKEKEYLLIAGFLLRAVAWIGLAFSSSLIHIGMAQIIIGIGEALGSPAFDALFAEHLDKDKHIRDYSSWKIISNLFSAIATLAGGFLVASLGFTPLFLLMAAIAVICSILVFLKPRSLL